MSCASAEGFINEMDYWSAVNGLNPNRLNERGKLIPLKGEKTHERFRRILSTVMPSFSSANNPFDYLNAKDVGLNCLRNRVVHQNHLDEFANAGGNENYDRLLIKGFVYDEADSPTQMVMPSDVMALHRLGLLKSTSKDSWETWFELIKTQKLAWWVCSATRDAVIKVLTEAPPEIVEGFLSWRELAVAELPPVSLKERMAGDSDFKTMMTQEKYGAPSFIYTMMPGNEIVFTKADGSETSGSTVNYAHPIVETIIQKEGIDPTEYSFLDLHTHFNHGFSKSGEYELYRLKLASDQGNMTIDGWMKVAEAKNFDGEVHLLVGENDPKVAQIAKKFSAFIGKPAPF
jgi:hypothetical protein